jgi:hypothetical protein
LSTESFWEKVKKFNRINLAEVFLPGYIFNKIIFRVGIALIFLWLLLAGWSMNFVWGEQFYIHCPEKSGLYGTPCRNAFYNPLDRNPTCVKYGICDKELLSPGETYGNPPSFFASYFGTFTLIMVFVMVLLNHTLFNREYFKERKVRI